MPIGSFDSTEFRNSVLSKVAEWKPFLKFQSFQEKQEPLEIPDAQQLSELHEELSGAEVDGSHTVEKVAKLETMGGQSMITIDNIRNTELQAQNAKKSERKLLESMAYQAKQLEQTKISLGESKLEIMDLQESIRMMENSSKDLLEPADAQEEIKQLRNELRLALEAEENSQKAMDDFAIALKEATAVASQAKYELALRQSELLKTREEAESNHSLIKCTEQKLAEVLNMYDRTKLEYEESVSAWTKKEDGLVNRIRVSEEELSIEKQENIKVANAWKAAREENAKLREIIKQAVNEAATIKEALENAQNESSQLKNQLAEKENSLQQIQDDYESLKVSEGAARDRVNELKGLLAPSFASDMKGNSNTSEVGSINLPKATNHGTKLNKCLKIFPSEKGRLEYRQASNSRKSSASESEMIEGLRKDKKTVHKFVSSNSYTFNASLFKAERSNSSSGKSDLSDGMLALQNYKKKKTVFSRLGNSLRRRSFHY